MLATAVAGLCLGVVLGMLCVPRPVAAPRRPARQVYIERLRLLSAPQAQEYVHVLELTRPRQGETLAELHDGYVAYLRELPQRPETDRFPVVR